MISRIFFPSLFFLTATFALFVSQSLHAENGISAEAPSAEYLISTGEYCEFLNATAATDSVHFYDEKMEHLIRTGTPGSYHYEATGEEENPATLLSSSVTLHYFHWLESQYFSSTEEDPSLSMEQEANLLLTEPEESNEPDILLANATLQPQITSIASLPILDLSCHVQSPTSVPYQKASPISKPSKTKDVIVTLSWVLGGLVGAILGEVVASALMTYFAISGLMEVISTALGCGVAGAALISTVGKYCGELINYWMGLH